MESQNIQVGIRGLESYHYVPEEGNTTKFRFSCTLINVDFYK